MDFISVLEWLAKNKCTTFVYLEENKFLFSPKAGGRALCEGIRSHPISSLLRHLIILNNARVSSSETEFTPRSSRT